MRGSCLPGPLVRTPVGGDSAAVRIHFCLLALLGVVSAASAGPGDYFSIRVVDADTGRGVPLVELRTTDDVVCYTDGDGYVAWNELGRMDGDVWFTVASWGYQFEPAAFGIHGVVLHPAGGGRAELKVKRTHIAERLYRLTGRGTYRDSILLGLKPPVVEGSVTGQDTVQTAVYRGKMFWIWGDTNRADFPLGNFHTTAATSPLPGGFDPERGIPYTYFTDRAGKNVAPMVDVPGFDDRPIWVDGLMVTGAGAGEKLFARYCAVDKAMKPVRSGVLLFDDGAKRFREAAVIPAGAKLFPSDHPLVVADGGRDYFYFPRPFCTVRVAADEKSVVYLSAYQGYTCVAPDGSVTRDPAGGLVWSWRTGADPVGPDEADRLIATGKIKADESPYRLRDAGTKKPVKIHNGSVAWNPYLKRYLMLFGQQGGDSVLGEIWMASADHVEGPWVDAVKVASHGLKGNVQDLYNPMQHPELAGAGGRVVYFEGTFVNTFTGNPITVPRYNYNQLMYRVDLADPRLKPAED